MKTSKCSLLVACGIVLVAIVLAFPSVLPGQTAASKSSGGNSASTRWSVQIDRVDPGNRDLAYSFQVAIYENLVKELKRTKQFQQVFRDGDVRAGKFPNLLVLKTTAEKYRPGSETRRAVTTVSGATKLTVRSQLLTREGKVVFERIVNGDARFFGSNLRATHNLAHNIAKTIKQSSWRGSGQATAILNRQPKTWRCYSKIFSSPGEALEEGHSPTAAQPHSCQYRKRGAKIIRKVQSGVSLDKIIRVSRVDKRF
jgi:hypothetical protein